MFEQLLILLNSFSVLLFERSLETSEAQRVTQYRIKKLRGLKQTEFEQKAKKWGTNGV